MKKLLLVLFAWIFAGLFGCGGFQVTDSATNKVLAYASGKAMAIGIIKIRPEVDPELTSEWVALMDRNSGNESVSSAEMLAFYNQCVSIIAGQDFDKYGLIGDLSMLLTIYGAEIDDSGRMTNIQPVPLVILKSFEIGYANGRMVAE